MGAFEDFVNLELPKRISTNEDGEGSGSLPSGRYLRTTGVGLGTETVTTTTLSGDADHDLLTNTHNLTTDIDHNTITNNHNLTTDINHNLILNNHNLTTDIDHNQLTNFVSNEHINWTSASAGTIHASNYVDNDTTDHTAFSNIGTNAHSVIDTHIADSTIHYLQSAISIPASQISDFDTEVSNNSSVTANTSKVTNATHTGEVTGSTTLTVDKTAITGKSTVTADNADFVLISDTSDTGNLKKALVSDFGGAGGSPGGSNTQVQFNDGGSFGGDSDLTYDKATGTLTTKILDLDNGTNIWKINNFPGANELRFLYNDVLKLHIRSDGDIVLNGGTIDGVPQPTFDSQVANKEYVDGLVAGSLTKFVSITIEDPTNVEDINICRFNDAVTVFKVVAVLKGADTPSVTIEPKHSTDRSAAGNDVLVSEQAITSTTTGDSFTGMNDPTIPADSFLWLTTTAKSGTVTELNVTIFYTID